MTSTERSRAWRAKIGPKAVRAYLNAKYPKYRDRILAGNKRWRQSLDPEVRKQRNRAQYLKDRVKILEASRQWRLENSDQYKKFLREWRVKNPEYMRKYRRTNRNKIAEQTREWRVKNAARLKEYDRLARIKNRERRAEHNKYWRSKNPDKRNGYEALRRAKKQLATIGDLTKVAKIYERAAWWAQWFAVEVDHIIPLSRNGLHKADNLQIIYGFENARKHNNPNYKPRVVFT